VAALADAEDVVRTPEVQDSQLAQDDAGEEE